MEYSVHIQSPRDLDRWDRLASWEPSGLLRPLTEALFAALGPVTATHVAWGTEFCENLISGPAPLAEAYRAARSHGLEFTLLTPYTGNHGLARLRILFAALAGLGPAEVVFNDWGVLRVLGREFPMLKPVQGRLMFKSLRDPRVMGEYAKGADTPTLAALRSSNLTNSTYSAMFARYGVDMVEMDALPQGNDWNASGMRTAVYFPYGFISTARVCMAAGLGYRKTEKFQPAAPCRHECQTHLVEYAYSNSPFENRDQRFWLKGNTYFYTQASADEIRRAPVDRIVLQPRLPMLEGEPALRLDRSRQPQLVQLG